jgi:23S rRNA (cytosine1962-C5)-methyltransferase
MQIKKWINKGFDEYELIDAGGGKKLERWGDMVTVRPELQAYFKSGKSFSEWNNLNPLTFEEVEGRKGKWKCKPTKWEFKVNELTIQLETTTFKHIGIFPEQHVNWSFLTKELNTSKRFLNLFAYTGVASLVARSTGAEVTHVDSVKQLISWARKNMELSQLDGIKWVHEDALKFAQREVKRRNTYDGIVMDPPAWGIGAKGEKWKIEDQLPLLIETAATLLSKNGFLIINTYSPRVDLKQIYAIATRYFKKENIEIGELWTETSTGKELFHGHLLRARK